MSKSKFIDFFPSGPSMFKILPARATFTFSGIVIFIFTLFLTIVTGKTLGRVFTWTGVGSIDKTFGLLFGFFKGYVISICLFSMLNWFYPYQNWGISAENAITFDIVKKGSEILVEEFPSNEDFIDTKNKIEKI